MRGKKKKDVSTTSESTYKAVSKARESKMPADSSVRALLLKNLKESNKK